jgi:hypothetical protein
MTNPFAILSLEPTATKREILTAVTTALRAGRGDARAIAEAQKTLFDPLARAVAEFEHGFDACAGLTHARPPSAAASDKDQMPKNDRQPTPPDAIQPRDAPRLDRLL